MASEMEKLVQKATSMGDLCEQAEISSEFMQQFVASNGRFSWKQLQGENSRSTYTAAIEDRIHDYSSQIHQVDLTVTLGKLIWRSVPGGTGFQTSIANVLTIHFKVKCLDHSCSYCQLNPPRMPDFENVHFLPDSVQNLMAITMYLLFDDLRIWAKYVWWVQTLLALARSWQTRQCRALTPAGGWRCSWLCSVHKCPKYRCIYAASKLSASVWGIWNEGHVVCLYFLWNTPFRTVSFFTMTIYWAVCRETTVAW